MSLSLEGKAYKWWMAYPSAKKPKTWVDFESASARNFSPLMREEIGKLGICASKFVQAKASLAHPIYLYV